MKLKWIVSPAPTGPYRSFEKRGWPSAQFDNGKLAAAIYCEDSYKPRNVKTGNHKPLTLCIADHSPSQPEQSVWRWRKATKTFATLAEAKAAVHELYNKFPHFLPKDE